MTELTTSFTFALLEQQVAYANEVTHALADRAKRAPRTRRLAAPENGGVEASAPSAHRIEAELTYPSSEAVATQPPAPNVLATSSSEAQHAEVRTAGAPVQAASEAQRADFVAADLPAQASSEAQAAEFIAADPSVQASSEAQAAEFIAADPPVQASSEAEPAEFAAADPPTQASSESRYAEFVAAIEATAPEAPGEGLCANTEVSSGQTNGEHHVAAAGAGDTAPFASEVAVLSDPERPLAERPMVAASECAADSLAPGSTNLGVPRLPDEIPVASLLAKARPAPASITGPRIAKNSPKPAKMQSVSANQTTPPKTSKSSKSAKKK